MIRWVPFIRKEIEPLETVAQINAALFKKRLTGFDVDKSDHPFVPGLRMTAYAEEIEKTDLPTQREIAGTVQNTSVAKKVRIHLVVDISDVAENRIAGVRDLVQSSVNFSPNMIRQTDYEKSIGNARPKKLFYFSPPLRETHIAAANLLKNALQLHNKIGEAQKGGMDAGHAAAVRHSEVVNLAVGR